MKFKIQRSVSYSVNMENEKTHRQKFTAQEDERLTLLVKEFGTGSWKKIAQLMKTRSTRQCRERYLNYLSPELKNGPWSSQEDQYLLKLVKEMGPCWSKITKFFPTRSDVNVKNRYSFHVSKGRAPSLKKLKPKIEKIKKERENKTCLDQSNVQFLANMYEDTTAAWTEKFFSSDIFNIDWQLEGYEL